MSTLHVTNWSSRPLHGPGRILTIMANPRPWEWGDGRVTALTPRLFDLSAVRNSRISHDHYRERCQDWFARTDLRPGELKVVRNGGRTPVRDGDTLCCACSVEAAADGRCHRVWAAGALVAAGWRVLLDGAELRGVTADGRPDFAVERSGQRRLL